MTMRPLLIALLVCAAPLSACKEGDGKAKPATSSTAKPSAKPSAKPQGTASARPLIYEDADLATPADFEEEAEKSITKDNYVEQLDAIDAELNPSEAGKQDAGP